MYTLIGDMTYFWLIAILESISSGIAMGLFSMFCINVIKAQNEDLDKKYKQIEEELKEEEKIPELSLLLEID